MYKRLNLTARKISLLRKIIPLKFNTKMSPLHWKIDALFRGEYLRVLRFKYGISQWEDVTYKGTFLSGWDSVGMIWEST